MNENQMMWVKHPKHGRGYILAIAEDFFAVRFLFRRREYFPLTAFDDGTLTAAEETVKHFKERHKRLIEWADSGKDNPSES